MGFVKGQRVLSGKWGLGTIREVLGRGNGVRVWFDIIDSTQLVGTTELRLLDEPSPPTSSATPTPDLQAATATSSPPPMEPRATPRLVLASPSHLESSSAKGPDEHRLAVECLRQGLPPPGALHAFTVGHKRARNRVDAAISRAAEGQGSVLVVKADYGQGKSHLGRLARELAHGQGLMTMHVELDGEGLSFSRSTTSARVISSLLSSTTMPEVDTGESDHLVPGLGTVLRRAVERLGGRVPKDLALFAPFLRHADTLLESEEAVEVVEDYLSGEMTRWPASYKLTELLGDRVTLPTLGISSGTAANRRAAQADLVALVVTLGMAAGAKGALITLDEIDHDLRDRSSEVLNMLGHLARIAGHVPIVMVMLTPTELGLSVKGAVDVALEPLDTAELNALMKRTIDTYAATYPLPALEHGREDLMDALLARFEKDYREVGWGPRFFVRSTIEACEMTRHRNLESLAEVAVA